MQTDTGLIIDVTRKASRFLQRDYFELENLQSSSRGTDSFCQKSCSKALQILHEGLSKYYKTIILTSAEIKSTTFTGQAALVETLEGLGNLERALPFFAIMVTIVSSKNGIITPERSIINFPALGEIYYAEKGKGAWFERHSSNFTGAMRLRVSGVADITNAVVATINSKLQITSKIFHNIRLYESYTYSLAMLIAGKIDAMIVEPSEITTDGIRLFVEESGGSINVDGDTMLVSNFKLYDKIKDLL